MNTITLNNGVQMPLLGYGTYQEGTRITEGCVAEALRAGYRSIDTAQWYRNEREVGAACRKSGIPREELFITTKLWACRGYADTLQSIDTSLLALGLDYIDLMLIHEPGGDEPEIYRAMETALRAGKLRAIGISNFLADKYSALLKRCEIVPAVNQMETHIFYQQSELRRLEAQHGTAHESWSPLACGRNGIFRHPLLSRIARELGATPAQVTLRFLTQQGIIAIPKTAHPDRMRENLASLHLTLTPNHLTALTTLDTHRSLFGWY